MMHETFEHTADLGLRVRAADLGTLFVEAAQALFAAIIENPETIAPTQAVEFRIDGDDRELLLFDWLRELLCRFEVEHLVFARFKVSFDATGLTGTAWGEPLDWSKHAPNHEVKAITYHALRVEQTADGWLAEVIVDI